MDTDRDGDITDQDIDDIVNSFNDVDDILDAYDDDEFMEVPDELNEVLSRVERLKAKIRMQRNKTKRTRKLKIALKRKSNNETLLRRARKLAIKGMKIKLAKKNIKDMNFSDKVRVEKIIAKRKAAIDRIARKLLPKVRTIEKERLTHDRHTK
jgi:hypothetical protein